MKGELLIIPISEKEIFNIISPYDVYRHYLGDVKPNRAICNPFRKDNNPSFVVGTNSGEWRHFDFSRSEWRGNCIDLVKQIYSCDYPEALKIIDRDFNLGIGAGYKVKKSNTVNWEAPDIELHKPPLFQIITKKFTREGLAWWNQYHQDINDLKREEIYMASKIYRNRRLIPQKESLLTFCYFEPSTSSWKIYRPHGSTNKDAPIEERKWDSNIKFDVIEGISNLNNCEIGIIATSRKDSMVIKKALSLTCCCNVQGENPHAFTKENLDYINKNVQLKIAAGDNDKPGKEFTWWLTKEHGYKHINPPDNTAKDFAEWGKNDGLDVIYKHFKNKQIV